jgi:hypothetical protein
MERSIKEAPKAIRLPKLSSEIDKILTWKGKYCGYSAQDLIEFVQREPEMKVLKF